LSFFIDSAPAPPVVLILTGMFVAAFIASTISTARAESRSEAA
jgi:manganese/iron transport system permease protein